MSYWLVESSPLSLEAHLESYNNEDSDDISEDEIVSGSQSDCSKEYDDDDFDNKSLEIDEEERNKISAQINPDDDEDEEEENDDGETEDEEKEEIVEKEDSGQEKNIDENDDQEAAGSNNSTGNNSSDEDLYQEQQVPTAGPDDEELSMTESAESRTLDAVGHIQKLESEKQQLLLELERDEQLRQYFYHKLKTITQKLESWQQSENSWMQNDIARRQLEMEAYRVQEAMQEKLGQREESQQRQESKLERVQIIEAEILFLMTKTNRKQLAKGVKDLTALTVLPTDVSDSGPHLEDRVEGLASERAEKDKSQSVPLSAKVGEAKKLGSLDGVAPGIPLSANLFGSHNDSFLKGQNGLLSCLSISQDCNMSSLGPKQSPPLSLVPREEDQPHVGTKVEMVYSLLNMLGTHDKEDMSRTLFAMSQSDENCIAMRQAGCLPLLLQLLHGNDNDSGLLGKTRGSKTARARAAAALHNIVHCCHDDKKGRREARTLRLLEQIRAHCDQQREGSDEEDADDSGHAEMDHHPGAAIAALMKLSFDEDYRHAICTLGGLQAIAELLEIDNQTIIPMNDYSTTIRRYSCMALTNLTFGDGKNKALLCSMRNAMEALTDQLRSTNEDLIQAAASVLRNLSWRADLASKKTMREIHVVTTLIKAAMTVKKETTLKSILSALWNLSSHCSENKAEICAVEGALQFLVSLLTYKSTAKTLAIIENGGGILRNISSQIAIREEYRQILRKHECLKILLFHLKSPSLTIVSNACGTLWNLSARCEDDQNALRDMGAISMLRNLIHSRHKMISSGSSAALKNLLSSIPAGKSMDNDRSTGSPRPSLHVRKQRALEAELDHSLSETCENVDSPRNSPTEIVHRSESEPRRFVYHLGGVNGHWQEEDTRKHMTRRQMMPRNGIENVNNVDVSSSGRVPRAGSQDSVGSTHSDISHDRTRTHTMLAKSSILLHRGQGSSSLDRKDPQSEPHIIRNNPNNPHNLILDYTFNETSNSNTYFTNDNHAQISSLSPGNPNHQLPGYNQGWNTLPNNQVAKQKREVADTSTKVRSPSLLTQSAPPHCQTFQPVDLPNNQTQQSLLQRLAKPSSGLSGSCNLNNSFTLSSSDMMDFRNCLSPVTTVLEETNQPLNYSLKQQEGVSKCSKSSSRSNMILSYQSPTSSITASIAPGSLDENFKLCKNSRTMEHKSNLIEKAQTNNKLAANILVSNTNFSSAHKPLPNLVHNLFNDPPDEHPALVQQTQPQALISKVPCMLESPYTSMAQHYSGHPLQVYNACLPSPPVIGCSGYPSQGKPFNTCTDQFSMLQTAHRKALPSYPFQQSSTNTDFNLDFPLNATGLGLSFRDNPQKHLRKRYQDQPINYSLNQHNKQSVGLVIESSREAKHQIELTHADFKNTKKSGTSNFTEHQNQTPYIDSSPYKITNTNLSSLTCRNGSETNLPDLGICNCENVVDSASVANSEIKTDFKRDEARTDICIKEQLMYSSSGDYNKCALSQATTCDDDDRAVTCPSRLPTDHITEARKSNNQLRLNGYLEKVSLACIEEADVPEVMGLAALERRGTVNTSIPLDSSQRQTSMTYGMKVDGGFKTILSHREISQVEDILPISSRSSSSEYLNSCETPSSNSIVINKHDQRANEIQDMPLESVQSSPELASSLPRRVKEFLATSKSRNPTPKPGSYFDKKQVPVASDSFVSFAAFDEENKPINFAVKSQEFLITQEDNFSSFDEDQEQPQLTFSTFQKNFQNPVSNQSSHCANRLCTPKAKIMPTLLEQIAEAETSGKEPDFRGDNSMSQREKIMSLSSKENEPTFTNPHEAFKPNVEIIDAKVFGLENFQLKQHLDSSVAPLAGNHSQKDWDSSGSESSEMEEDILPLKVIYSLPMSSCDDNAGLDSSDNIGKKKSGIPMKISSSVQSKMPVKTSSIPTFGTKNSAPLSKSERSANCSKNYSDISDIEPITDSKKEHPVIIIGKNLENAILFKDKISTQNCLLKDPHNVDQANERKISDHQEERKTDFDVEDNCRGMYRNSSLNSISSTDGTDHLETSSNEDHDRSVDSSTAGAPGESSVMDESTESSATDINCQVICSSSSGSLSEELAELESTPARKTLLAQGNTSIPQIRLCENYDDDLDSRHLQTKTPCFKGVREIEKDYIAYGLPKSVSMDMANDYYSGSDIDPGSQSSLSQNHSSSENYMSHSCSDGKDFDLNFPIPPFLSWQSRCKTWCHQGQQFMVDDYVVDDSFIGVVSPEEAEKLLTENVNLVMSEIQTNKLSGSSIDEDLFIEHETISLVSHGYTSDTNSEVSNTWSVASDKASDLSSATLAANKNQASTLIRRVGPKLVKPDAAQHLMRKPAPENDGAIPIRGRRKPLYPGKSNNVAVAVRGNLKIIAQNINKPVNVPINNKIIVQNGPAKAEVGRAVLGLKKTPPRTQNGVQISPKAVLSQLTVPQNKNVLQKTVVRRSRSAGPATTMGKNRLPLSIVASPSKTGLKNLASTQPTPQGNRSSLGRTVSKIGGAPAGKFSSPITASISSPGARASPETPKPTTGASIPVSLSKIPTSASASPGNSKIPNTSSNNKTTNNLTTINNKKNCKLGGQATRSASNNALSSSAVDKKIPQNPSKFPNLSSTNTTTKSSESGIPRRKSAGSSPSVHNTESTKNIGTGANKQSSPINTNQGKSCSSGITDVNKTTSSVTTDFKKRTSSGNTATNRRISSSSMDIKSASPNNTEQNKRLSITNADSGKQSSTNMDTGKRSSPNLSDLSKRSTLNNMYPVKHSTPTNQDPSKGSSPNNTEPLKRTPPGAVIGRKQSSSKIATLWKKGVNHEKSPSRSSLPSSSPSASSKLPVSATKPSPPNPKQSSLVPQGFKKKAATLPNSSLASSKTRTFSERISKSSTYEKLSSELQKQNGKSIAEGVETTKKTNVPAKLVTKNDDNFDSSESDVGQRPLVDSSSSDEDITGNQYAKLKNNVFRKSGTKVQTNSFKVQNDSLENVSESEGSHQDNTLGTLSNNLDSIDQTDDSDIFIDSSTFRKKKRNPGISGLDLPNADETCRSVSSLSDYLGTSHIYKSSPNVESILRKMSIIDILESEMTESSERLNKHQEEKPESKSKSSVAQGLKKLFSSKNKEKDKEIKEKNSNKDSSKSRNNSELSKSRHSEKECKTKQHKSNNKSKRSNKDKREYDFFRTNIKIEPSTTWTVEDSLDNDLETNSVFPIRQMPPKGTVFTLGSTAVAPEVDPHVAVEVKQDENHCEINSEESSVSEKHMTKTEMLLARRRKTTLTSSQSDDSHGENEFISLRTFTAV